MNTPIKRLNAYLQTFYEPTVLRDRPIIG